MCWCGYQVGAVTNRIAIGKRHHDAGGGRNVSSNLLKSVLEHTRFSGIVCLNRNKKYKNIKYFVELKELCEVFSLSYKEN